MRTRTRTLTRTFFLLRSWLHARLRDERGGVQVEYIAVFAFVSIGLTLSFIKLGPTLLEAWGTTQHVLLANKP